MENYASSNFEQYTEENDITRLVPVGNYVQLNIDEKENLDDFMFIEKTLDIMFATKTSTKNSSIS